MKSLANNVLTNWKTTSIGVILAVIGVIQASHAPSIQAAFKDPHLQLEMLAAVGLALAKDSDKTGTKENPR